MRRQTVPVLGFVVLLLLSTVAVTLPAAAEAAEPDAAGAVEGNAQPAQHSPQTFDDTAFLALADAGGGAVVAGGVTGATTRQGNATLARVGADGDFDWTVDFETAGRSQVADVAVADDGDVYFLVSEQPAGPGYAEPSFRLGRATSDGTVTWQEPINATGYVAAGVSLVGGDDGVTVAHRQGDAVRMARYVGPDPVWEQTYGVDARPRSLHATEDGYLLVGNADFDHPWVLRTTQSGRERHNRTYTGVDAGRVLGARPTDDGGVLLGGQGRPGEGLSTVWSARIGADGFVRGTSVHTVDGDARFSRALAAGDGLVFVGQRGRFGTDNGTLELVGIGDDGARTFDTDVAGIPFVTAAARTGDGLTVASVTGLENLPNASIDGELRSVSLPDPDVGTTTPGADVGLASNETVYRGQNLRVERPGASGRTYDLVRVPGEYDDFEPRVVRRIDLGADGRTVVESATLPEGRYVLRTTDGESVTLSDGRITDRVDPGRASFDVRAQDFFTVEPNRTFVDVASGDRRVALSFDSDRSDYDVYVTVDSSRGADPAAAALRAAFDDVDGFRGVETVDGQPAARITVTDENRIRYSERRAGDAPRPVAGRHLGEQWVVADASAFGPGLYDVTVAGVDTRDGGAVATGRVVVGTERERPIGAELGNRTLTVPVGGSAETTVTLSNLTDGVSALSMSANRTGEPAIGLRMDANINASIGRGSAGWSDRSASASAAAFEGDTANGTVTVGTFGVQADDLRRRADDGNLTGTNTVSVRVDWVVDESGVPYTVPDGTTVTVEVVPAENGTEGGPGGQAPGGESGGQEGSGSGSSSGSGSGSGSGSTSGGSGSASGSGGSGAVAGPRR